jgi:hypothetical protein
LEHNLQWINQLFDWQPAYDELLRRINMFGPALSRLTKLIIFESPSLEIPIEIIVIIVLSIDIKLFDAWYSLAIIVHHRWMNFKFPGGILNCFPRALVANLWRGTIWMVLSSHDENHLEDLDHDLLNCRSIIIPDFMLLLRPVPICRWMTLCPALWMLRGTRWQNFMLVVFQKCVDNEESIDWRDSPYFGNCSDQILIPWIVKRSMMLILPSHILPQPFHRINRANCSYSQLSLIHKCWVCLATRHRRTVVEFSSWFLGWSASRNLEDLKNDTVLISAFCLETMIRIPQTERIKTLPDPHIIEFGSTIMQHDNASLWTLFWLICLEPIANRYRTGNRRHSRAFSIEAPFETRNA